MTEPLWTSEQAQKATNGENSHPWQASGVSIDTRTLQPGDLFVALQGDALDGHDYLDAAFAAGAAAAVVSRDVGGDWPLLRVKDTTAALVDLGRAARARCGAKVIGVTGSAGKTGTKEMLAAMLSGQGRTHYNVKSLNNHWGVPLTLARLPQDCVYAVIEMGMNHAGELTDLSALVRPDIALITTIEPAHIEHFKTVEAIADAKAEIFSGMKANGVAILPSDSPHFTRLKAAAEKQGLQKIIPFGEDDEEASARLIDCTLHADSSKVTAEIGGVRVRYRLSIAGKHIVMNSLAALATVQVVGADLSAAVESLKNAQPVAGRGNRFEVMLAEACDPVVVIDDSYNANPASMKAAFTVLEMMQPAQGGRRIAVLGDMLELGKEGPRLHEDLANPLLRAKVDVLFCCGAQMEALYQKLPPDWQGAHARDSQALAALVTQAIRPGDVVLVKGSAGSKMAYVVQALADMNVQNPAVRKGDF